MLYVGGSRSTKDSSYRQQMSQGHPLQIHLVAPTGTRNWSTAIAFTCAMLVGCAFLDRRDAVVALIAHAAALLAATLDLTPGLTWKGVGPEQRENMHPWLRRWMSTVALFGLVLPLVCAPWSPLARAHPRRAARDLQ